MEPHASLAVWEGDKLTVHTLAADGEARQHSVADDPQDSAREVHLLTPLHRRRLRRQAAGLRRRDPGGPGGARAQAAGEGRADAPADVPRHHPPPGDRPARAAGRRTRRHAHRHRPRDWSHTARGSTSSPSTSATRTRALCRAQPAHRPPARAAGPAGRRFDARAGRGLGMLASKRPWTSWPSKLGLDPIELRLRNEPDGRPGERQAVLHAPAGRCLQEGAQPFGWDRRRRARPGARRPLAGRHGHGGRDPRQLPAAGQGAGALDERRHVTCVEMA